MRFGIRELLFLVLLAAMPVAAFFFIFEPRNAQIEEARAEIVQKQQKLKQLEQATRSIEDLGAEIERLQQAIALFEEKLPAEREVDVILKQVWELASRHSLKPKSIRTDKPVKAAQYSELPIKMVIVGDFDGFYSFLLELERLSRITRMPSVKMKKIEKEDGKMQADVILSVFFEPQSGGMQSHADGANTQESLSTAGATLLEEAIDGV